MKKIALYLSMFFTITGFVLSSADVQAQEGENVESVSMDSEPVPDHSRDEIWRFTVGLEHMAMFDEKAYNPFIASKLGFYGNITDFYRTGIEVDIAHDLMESTGGLVSINIMWMHVLRFVQADFFELSQRLGVGYWGLNTYGTEDCNGWTHLMSWLIGYEFGFRLSDLISLSLNIDYTINHTGIEDSLVGHRFHAGVQVGFHF